MRRTLSILLLLAVTLWSADDLAEKIRIQNQNVVKAAAEARNKELPQKVDPYTTLIAIRPEGETLHYIFEIDAGPKSDEQIVKEGEARMRRNVTAGLCSTSQRFLKSGITILYDYRSAKTKKPLFRIAVDEKRCNTPLQ